MNVSKWIAEYFKRNAWVFSNEWMNRGIAEYSQMNISWIYNSLLKRMDELENILEWIMDE